jgi:hypothetical protein
MRLLVFTDASFWRIFCAKLVPVLCYSCCSTVPGTRNLSYRYLVSCTISQTVLYGTRCGKLYLYQVPKFRLYSVRYRTEIRDVTRISALESGNASDVTLRILPRLAQSRSSFNNVRMHWPMTYAELHAKLYTKLDQVSNDKLGVDRTQNCTQNYTRYTKRYTKTEQ